MSLGYTLLRRERLRRRDRERPSKPPGMPRPTQPPPAFDRRASYTRHVDRQSPVTPVRPAVDSAYSSETGRTYRLDRLIGKGGFGEVYLATPSGAGSPDKVCVKISDRLSGWLREAYFAELLAREPRALRVFDRFVDSVNGEMRYCLAMEYAEEGDLGAWLERVGAQSERFVRRELSAIAGALDALHRGHALHRDLTPFNVFVCAGNELKLGDFGIATHQLSRRGVTADAFNLFHVPNEIAWGRVRRWQKRDDVYQIGLLAAMLLRGDITSPMRSKDVRSLPCSDHLKEVIHGCLGSRGKRYESARELIAALRKPPKEPSLGRVASLEGKGLLVPGFPRRPPAGGDKGGPEGGGARPLQARPVDGHPRPRPAERPADRRSRWWLEADPSASTRRRGDQGDRDR